MCVCVAVQHLQYVLHALLRPVTSSVPKSLFHICALPRISHTHSTPCRLGLSEPGTYLPCATWSANSVSGGGFGASLASTPARFTATHGNPTDATSYTSSTNLPLSVSLFDVFGQEHTPAVVNSVEAGATTVVVNDTDTTGQRAARLGGRDAAGFPPNFTQLALYAVPGPRTLQLLGELKWVGRTLAPQQVGERVC